jgi:hypothetical protein
VARHHLVTVAKGDPITRSTADLRRAWVVIGESWPRLPIKGGLEVKDAHSVSVGFALKGTIGWQAGGTNTQSAGVSSDYNGLSSLGYQSRLGMVYQKLRSTCGSEWIKSRWPDGGHQKVHLNQTDFPTAWKTCRDTLGTWKRERTDRNSYSLSGGVKLADQLGINLAVNSNYAASRTLTHAYNGTYEVCGNNDVPARASRVRTETK